MAMLPPILAISVFGMIGGVINALLTDNGFLKPKRETTDHGDIFRPGYFGNMFIGAVSAFVSWGLYGPFAAVTLLGPPPAPGTPPPALSVTLSALAGAVLVGIGGARWLTNEVDKKLLRAAASSAAAKQPDQDISAAILAATPAAALGIVKTMR